MSSNDKDINYDVLWFRINSKTMKLQDLWKGFQDSKTHCMVSLPTNIKIPPPQKKEKIPLAILHA
jgi:hypothetical protein